MQRPFKNDWLHCLVIGPHVHHGHLFAAGISIKPFYTLHDPASLNPSGVQAFLMSPTFHMLPFSHVSQSGVPTAMLAHLLAYQNG